MSPFPLISTRHIYKNPWISVREDAVVRPDGQSGIFGVVTVQDGAHIVAIDTDDYIYLGREYCYGMRAYTYRLPGGGISVGETPLDAAKKELREEAGIVADTWIPIGSIYPLTTVTENIQYLYIAK
jgi:8-oxo-dGTP pyrophosphatase MutT (NUDIX family)